MQPIRITRPGGIIPRLSPRQLPDGAAQIAANVSVLPGEWRPLRKPAFLWAPAISADPIQSVFRLDDTTWFAWTKPNVRVARTAIEGESRYVISGDGAPKIITKALATPASASGLPAAARTLGIPAPPSAPTVGHSGGSGAATSRIYVYTFVSDWNEEGPPSPATALTTGKVDDTWAITNMLATPPNSGTVTAAVAGTGTVTLTLNAPHLLRAGDDATIGGIVGMTDANGVWTVSAVPAANQITIPCTTAQTYTSGGTWARTYPWATCTKRLYRTVGTAGQFQLVAEGISGTSYNDTILDAAIPGDDLISDGWSPPPTNLVDIISMPNGMMVGWTLDGRTLYFCEPFQPHAWPDAYKKILPDDIVGIAAFGTSLGVATKGLPRVYTGIDPVAMSPVTHDKPLPCVSRASVSSKADGVVFATKGGLAAMDLGGVAVFTEGLFLADQWNALQPSAMACSFDGTRLFISTPVENRLYTLDLINGGAMVTAYQRLQCTHVDPRTGQLYFALGSRVYEFDAFGTAPMVMDWMSREYVLATPANIGAAKVERDDTAFAEATAALAAEATAVIAANQVVMAGIFGGRGCINGRAMNVIEINGSVLDAVPDTTPTISFTYYAKGVPVFSKVIPDDRAFRLPTGFKKDRFAVRLQANTQVSAIVLGETPASLAGA